MDFQDDAAEFSSEDVDMIVKNAITGCLTDVMYNPKKVSERDKGKQASTANSVRLLRGTRARASTTLCGCCIAAYFVCS